MLKPTIIINELDAERIDMLLERPEFASSPVAQALTEEIDRAEIVAPEQMPADVVTMNSRVRFIDLSNQEERVRTLVFPNALTDSNEQLSVMAPIGAALLGLRVGADISWHLPNGTVTKIKVLELLHQPEAAGEHQ
ncbi:regulator of nucleoside diphosphate kinase [Leminorella grimontii]|uniref:Regulator of nucleoside diphosphate kinase n=1 Tax=Leminorella grimontii TaxID=82981 RepID=A0AAV5N2Y8_9GAMM|nr:nucleoside diphosphate kinase regulator [Leminorella grimontii]KFC94732.1 nucleoside diphosphate kinase regulator [Leminorella grimontii ATCC 33999 = DSM 5078]GKX56475.1 regulator of nucleoside diphosphate kinase [Leminorella grimontii]GKX59924.1 regulator of nucleoside diphosphate kinase [Leminorella grimontii]VFS61385.1 Regulator of nucleoside diphosphate kinase [Leminorella grimontii]